MTDVLQSRPADPAVKAAARGRVVSKRDRRRKVKQKTRGRRPPTRAPPASPGVEVRAYSIRQFCAAHGGISPSYFHALCAKGRGPRLMKVGGRTLVSTEAAAEWRRAQEAVTEQAK